MATEKKKKKIIKKPIGGPVKPKLPPKLPVDGRTPPPATIQPFPVKPKLPPDIDPDTGLKKPIAGPALPPSPIAPPKLPDGGRGPIGPITIGGGQPIDYTQIPNWDKLTPQEQQLLRIMVDNINSPIDVGSIPTFDFNEALATEAATAEYQPFYQEKLSDVYYQTQSAKQQAEEDYAKRLGISSEELRQSLEDIGIGKEQLGIQQQRGLEDIAEQERLGTKSLAESAAERGLTFSNVFK